MVTIATVTEFEPKYTLVSISHQFGHHFASILMHTSVVLIYTCVGLLFRKSISCLTQHCIGTRIKNVFKTDKRKSKTVKICVFLAAFDHHSSTA